MNTTILALDAHGGDQGLDVSIPAALEALAEDDSLKLVLVGRPGEIEAALDRAKPVSRVLPRLRIHPAETVLPMDAGPAQVLRRGRDSSLWKSFELVSGREAHACVSGSGTAAMMVAGVKVLGLLPGISRPALMAWLPNGEGFTGVLDLGANLNVDASQLVQFAVMGSVTARVAVGIGNPRVGLLNVGHEESKGHDTVQLAHERLRSLPINYTGFVEGHDIFSGKVDIAVCDGFAGNLVLKSSEGLSRMLLKQVKSAFAENLLSRSGLALAGPALKRMLARLDPSAHNGAPLLGLSRVAVKSHGNSDIHGMKRAIMEARREARRRVPEKIETLVREYQLESSS